MRAFQGFNTLVEDKQEGFTLLDIPKRRLFVSKWMGTFYAGLMTHKVDVDEVDPRQTMNFTLPEWLKLDEVKAEITGDVNKLEETADRLEETAYRRRSGQSHDRGVEPLVKKTRFDALVNVELKTEESQQCEIQMEEEMEEEKPTALLPCDTASLWQQVIETGDQEETDVSMQHKAVGGETRLYRWVLRKESGEIIKGGKWFLDIWECMRESSSIAEEWCTEGDPIVRTDVDIRGMILPPTEVLLFDIYRYLVEGSIRDLQGENCSGCIDKVENQEGHLMGCARSVKEDIDRFVWIARLRVSTEVVACAYKGLMDVVKLEPDPDFNAKLPLVLLNQVKPILKSSDLGWDVKTLFEHIPEESIKTLK